MAFVLNPFTGELTPSVSDAITAKALILERIAGETISAMKVLYLSDPATCKLGNNTTLSEATCVGIALNAASIGEAVRILSFGALDDSFFTFTLNAPVFLDTLGNMTTVQPSSGNYLTQIGFGLGSGSMYIKINSPKLL